MSLFSQNCGSCQVLYHPLKKISFIYYDERFFRFHQLQAIIKSELVRFHAIITSMFSGNAPNNHLKGDLKRGPLCVKRSSFHYCY